MRMRFFSLLLGRMVSDGASTLRMRQTKECYFPLEHPHPAHEPQAVTVRHLPPLGEGPAKGRFQQVKAVRSRNVQRVIFSFCSLWATEMESGQKNVGYSKRPWPPSAIQSPRRGPGAFTRRISDAGRQGRKGPRRRDPTRDFRGARRRQRNSFLLPMPHGIPDHPCDREPDAVP